MRFLILTLSIFFLLLLQPVKADKIPDTITVVNSNSWPPYSFTGEDGKPHGLLVDLWQEFAKRNNKKVKFIQTDWGKSLKRVKNKKAHVHAGLFESVSRDKYLDFTKELNLPLNTRLFISRKLNIANINNIGSIHVAVTNDGYAETFLKKNYPNVNLTPYPNVKECIESAVKGKVLAFATDYPAAMYYLHRFDAPDLFYVTDTLYTKNLCAAVSEGNQELLNFIQKGLNNIPHDEMDRITQKWIQAVSITPDWLTPVVISFFIVIVAAFTLTYIFILRRQVHKRTKELQFLSQTDMLTNLYNRRKIDELVNYEFNRFERYERPFTLILIDIDNFKKVNDTFGHAVGDEVLVDIANILLNNIRKTDYTGRWGGEEFIIICPETGEIEGIQLAEKLRTIIEQFRFKTISECTASFGVTQSRIGDKKLDIFVRCDAALYKSKESGRNKITRI